MHDVGDTAVVNDLRREKGDGVGQHLTAQGDRPWNEKLWFLQREAQWRHSANLILKRNQACTPDACVQGFFVLRD
jgi:hypothetical protein